MSGELTYFIAIVFASFFIYSFVGFGAGLVGIPLLLIVLPVRLVIPAFSALILTLFVKNCKC